MNVSGMIFCTSVQSSLIMIDVEYPICRFCRNSFDHAKPIRLFPGSGMYVCENIAVSQSSEKQIYHDPTTGRAVLVACTPFLSENNLETFLSFVLRDQPPA